MLNGTDTAGFEIRYKLTIFLFNVISDGLARILHLCVDPILSCSSYACSTAMHPQNFDAKVLFLCFKFVPKSMITRKGSKIVPFMLYTSGLYPLAGRLHGHWLPELLRDAPLKVDFGTVAKV